MYCVLLGNSCLFVTWSAIENHISFNFSTSPSQLQTHHQKWFTTAEIHSARIRYALRLLICWIANFIERQKCHTSYRCSKYGYCSLMNLDTDRFLSVPMWRIGNPSSTSSCKHAFTPSNSSDADPLPFCAWKVLDTSIFPVVGDWPDVVPYFAQKTGESNRASNRTVPSSRASRKSHLPPESIDYAALHRTCFCRPFSNQRGK